MTSQLQHRIKNLYDPPLPDMEAAAAANRLRQFFQILQAVDKRVSAGSNSHVKNARII